MPPVEWTADHVLRRMIEAYEFLARTKGGIGPKGYGSGWPPYLRDGGDESSRISNMIMPDGTIETEEARNVRLKKDSEESSRRLKASLSPIETSLMDEAMSWPACVN